MFSLFLALRTSLAAWLTSQSNMFRCDFCKLTEKVIDKRNLQHYITEILTRSTVETDQNGSLIVEKLFEFEVDPHVYKLSSPKRSVAACFLNLSDSVQIFTSSQFSMLPVDISVSYNYQR